jgi:hypothetical protein
MGIRLTVEIDEPLAPGDPWEEVVRQLAGARPPLWHYVHASTGRTFWSSVPPSGMPTGVREDR